MGCRRIKEVYGYRNFKTAGGQGFDTSVIIHIDTLRSMLDRPNESNSIL